MTPQNGMAPHGCKPHHFAHFAISPLHHFCKFTHSSTRRDVSTNRRASRAWNGLVLAPLQPKHTAQDTVQKRQRQQ